MCESCIYPNSPVLVLLRRQCFTINQASASSEPEKVSLTRLAAMQFVFHKMVGAYQTAPKPFSFCNLAVIFKANHV